MPPKKGENEPYLPYALRGGQFNDHKKMVVNRIKKGLPPREACMEVFEISKPAWNKWVSWYKEDVNKGFTPKNSRLVNLFISMTKADIQLHGRLTGKTLDLIFEDDNVDLLKFMLERRYGYDKKSLQEVELSSKDKAPVQFQIVPMKSVDDKDSKEED